MDGIPSFLKPYISKARLLKGSLQEIEFSGPTYQVKVLDPESSEELWVFLQLNAQGGLREGFCSCQESDQGGCWHLALAYLGLFDRKHLPLHFRFSLSFWSVLGDLLWERYGTAKLSQAKGWKRKGIEVSVQTKEGMEVLEEIFSPQKSETEENSIKFSNLSPGEIEAWESGEPSAELAFELSCWADFAKYLFLLDLKHPLVVVFPEKGEQLPSSVKIEHRDFTLTVGLSTQDWELLIPTLNSIKGNLHVFNRLRDLVKKVIYEPTEGAFHLVKLERKTPRGKGVALGKWTYVSGKGFYPSSSDLPKIVSGEEVEEFLKGGFEELESLISGIEWHQTPVEVHYHLHFDEMWNLHLDPYLFEVGDLARPESRLWGRYCYLTDRGVYKLNSATFGKVPAFISATDVPDFVRLQAAWLNQQEGFAVHVGNLETRIGYHVDGRGHLHFKKAAIEHTSATKEFGPWTYLEGQGFFQKTPASGDLSLLLQHPINADRISSFIRSNQIELTLVPGFFLEEDPLSDVGIEVHLKKENRIDIYPHYVLQPKYHEVPWRLYDEWIYLQDYGFFELPFSKRLPERIREPLSIHLEEFRSFFEKEMPSFAPWIRTIDPSLSPARSVRLILSSIQEGPHHSWMVKLTYASELGEIPLADIVKALQKRHPFLFSSAGRLDLHHERFKWLKKLAPNALDGEGILQLSTADLIRLHAFQEIIAKGPTSDLFREVIELKKTPPCIYSELKSNLRPYQKKGVEWLFSLYSYFLGGLLCDEMGLGKTHQAMGLLAAVRHLRPDAKFLVICPTSVLYHWEDKLREFFPSLRFRLFHGPTRRKELEMDCDLFLTSYGISRTEHELLSHVRFDLVIFDEIQVAKNHRSKLFRGLEKLQADVKIGLTGTPIENRLRELKTIFDLVLPGYMPSEADYLRQIVKPIEKEHDMLQKGLLHRLTYPFILRRQKVDVLIDLPAKTEAIAHCNLHPSQEKLYQEVLLYQRDQLLVEIFDPSKSVPFLHVFSLLSRLKQICDHPALYYKTPDAYKKYHSGKWDLFVELLKEARESCQKVVVYSQYLGMLDIIERYLAEEGIGFASLRGTTRDRKEQIALFSTDPSCEVFVASLKAGGLGIDLTAASVVIHYDRWWNAARENQATDRAHRFGQQKGVQVFKLVTKHTFEERIHQIIERKKELMEETIGVDDHDVLKAFTRDELYQLLLTPDD